MVEIFFQIPQCASIIKQSLFVMIYLFSFSTNLSNFPFFRWNTISTNWKSAIPPQRIANMMLCPMAYRVFFSTVCIFCNSFQFWKVSSNMNMSLFWDKNIKNRNIQENQVHTIMTIDQKMAKLPKAFNINWMHSAHPKVERILDALHDLSKSFVEFSKVEKYLYITSTKLF